MENKTPKKNLVTTMTIIAGFTFLAVMTALGAMCGVYSICIVAVAFATWLIISSQAVAYPWINAKHERKQVTAGIIIAGFVAMLFYGNVEYERVNREGPKTCTVRVEVMQSGRVKMFTINE